MNKEREKFMTELHRLLEAQDFKNEDEMKAFLAKMSGKPMTSMPKGELGPKEQAQDLVFEADNLPAAIC